MARHSFQVCFAFYRAPARRRQNARYEDATPSERSIDEIRLRGAATLSRGCVVTMGDGRADAVFADGRAH